MTKSVYLTWPSKYILLDQVSISSFFGGHSFLVRPMPCLAHRRRSVFQPCPLLIRVKEKNRIRILLDLHQLLIVVDFGVQSAFGDDILNQIRDEVDAQDGQDALFIAITHVHGQVVVLAQVAVRKEPGHAGGLRLQVVQEIMPVYSLHQVFLYEPAQVKIAVAHLDSGEILAIVVVNIDRDIV